MRPMDAHHKAAATLVEGHLTEEVGPGQREEIEQADARLDALFEQVADKPVQTPAPDHAAEAAPLAPVPMRVVQVVAVNGREAMVRAVGAASPSVASVAPFVDVEVVHEALAAGDAVLVECPPQGTPVVVGVLVTRRPKELHLRAAKIHIEADDELLLRSGRAAMRLRQSGDVELVGSRVAAMSRGLFRIVGRVLRLN